MSRFASPFKKIVWTVGILLCSYWGLLRTFARVEPVSSKGGYLIFAKNLDSEEDVRWAKYLYDHLKKRAENQEAVEYRTSDNDWFRISVRLDPGLKNDFEIKRHKQALDLSARDDEKMLWLQYQVMKKIADEDAGIAGADLPPAIVGLNDTCGTCCFEYRGIYSPSSRDADYAAIIGVDNLDGGWGLWGHNLYRVFGDEAPASVYATVDGKENRGQYCFSSPETYRLIEKYIESGFGDGQKNGMRFMIAPNDNSWVCTCPGCTAAGNTPVNATPAVTELVVRLARRFPHHTFFTSSYLTTEEPPVAPMPENTGVVVSAINWPFRVHIPGNEDTRNFAALLERWKRITNRLYIWDYINNFDDYLTPFPALKIMQSRLKFFRDRQVSGIFLNGSGYDYSSFDGMKTYVLSALLINPDYPVDYLTGAYLKQHFPAAGTKIASFYSALENRAEKCRRPLNLYGGIADAERNFLDVPGFIRFYEELERQTGGAGKEERKRLNRLLTALTFTRLEIARDRAFRTYGCAERQGERIGIKPETGRWLVRLGEYKAFPGMGRYRESGGEIKNYLTEWQTRILETGGEKNLLLGKTPRPLSPLDEGYEDLTVLTDGIPGLPGNYHCGWLLYSQADPEIAFSGDSIPEARTLRISFLHDPAHRIYAPERVELYKDGILYQTFPVPSGSGKKPQVVFVNAPVGLGDAKDVSIRVRRSGNRKAAIDEIQLNR